MLVYVAREWAKVSVKEISRRLHRDPSIISRLYAAYAHVELNRFAVALVM